MLFYFEITAKQIPTVPHRLPMRDLPTHFIDQAISTLGYLVADPATRQCAVIDPVLDFDYASGTLFLKVPINAFGRDQFDRLACDE